jgi:hypothetical protein
MCIRDRSEAKWLQFEKQRPEELLQKIIINNPNIRPSTALQMLGIMMATNTIGIRGIKSILGKRATATLKRLRTHINTENLASKALHKITDDLNRFEPARLSNIRNTRKNEGLTGE